MRCAKKIIFVLSTSLLSLIISNQAVFADEEVSISLSSSNLAITATPDVLATAIETITASTTSTYGYTIKLVTTGESADLVHEEYSIYTIPNFEIPAGQVSVPASSTGYGYGYSIDGGDNYRAFPGPEITAGINLFKTYEAGTNNHDITFGTLVSRQTIGGAYSNTFNFIILANLHCPDGYICYDGNGDDGRGFMTNQEMGSGGSTTLIAPNYSRPGYGFAGWNTESDGSGTFYGPSQTISNTSEGIQLYATWVASAGTIQDWNGCDSLEIGDVTALTDSRDDNTYAVAKLADGQCWMTENLRLDFSNPNVTITSDNTNSPSASFMASINSHPAPSNSFCDQTNVSCINQIKYNVNNMNRSLTASYNSADATSSWYGYGGYYNWLTATAGHGTFEFDVANAVAPGDICPAGWHMPTGYAAGSDLSNLDRAIGGIGASQKTAAASNRWRSYPQNFVNSGEYRGNAGYSRGATINYNTSTASNDIRAHNIWIQAAATNIDGNTETKQRGQTVRCILTIHHVGTNTIHYDANGGTGTVADDEDVDFAQATASANYYTRNHFEFANWNTKADGTGVTVGAGTSVANAATAEDLGEGDTLTLYAIWRPIYDVHYNGNNADAGNMNSITHHDVYRGSASTNTINLVAPDFSRAGYGFAGWSADQNAATKLLTGQSVVMYAPNQIVNTGTSMVSQADQDNQITLYATWIPEDTNYTMQTFTASECAAMSVGQVTALKDTRDNNVYTVAKLIDNHCWMTENLRLDPSSVTFTSENTNSPDVDFISKAATSSSTNSFCSTDGVDCDDEVYFNSNNINRSLTAKYDSNGNNYSWYGYGVYYNWYTATAGNGKYSTSSGNVTGDICPAGWRLPTGGSGGEYETLNTAANHTQTNNNSVIYTFPYNFMNSGDFSKKTTEGRSTFGRYWTATANAAAKAYRLGTATTSNTPTGSWNNWVGFVVRCVVK